MHVTLASYVLTMPSVVVQFHTGVDVEPKGCPFAWMLRHAAFVVGIGNGRWPSKPSMGGMPAIGECGSVSLCCSSWTAISGPSRFRAGARGYELASTR